MILGSANSSKNSGSGSKPKSLNIKGISKDSGGVLQRSSRSVTEDPDKQNVPQPNSFMYQAFRKNEKDDLLNQSVLLAKVFYLLDHKVTHLT